MVTGVPLAYRQDLCAYWRTDDDWRAAERRLGRLDHVRTLIDGVDIHLVHARSPHPAAMPLIITHGWPGSFPGVRAGHRSADRSAPLTEATPRTPFTSSCPSRPGYGFSGLPTVPGWGIDRIADAWAKLIERLGYPPFGAQGGDSGSSIATSLAQRHPDRLFDIDLTPPLAAPDPATLDDQTEAERAALAAMDHAAAWKDGYSAQQWTNPQTSATPWSTLRRGWRSG